MNFFREKKLRKEKIFAKFSESLVLDPSINIEIHKWDEDNVLLEKASIHRARLTRYGKSKMNGTMYYLGPKGGVYLLTPKGNRKYV